MTRFWLPILSLLAVCPIARCAEVPAKPDAQLQFHRVLVPENQLTEVGRGYLPLRRETFDELVAAIRSASAGPLGGTPRLAQAIYRGRLDEDGALRGSAELTVRYDGDAPAFLPLDGCRLALRSPRWGNAESRPAIVGRDERRRWIAVVDRSDTLLLDWSLRPDVGVKSADYRFGLPRCALNRMELDIPADGSISITAGIVRPGESRAISPANVEEAVATSRSLRVVELGATTDFVVTARVAGSTQPDSVTFYRQQATYDVSLRGIEMQSELALTAAGRLPSQLRVGVDPGVRIKSVTSGGQPLSWSRASEEVEGGGELTIQLRPSVMATKALITICGWMEASWADSWRLPTLICPQLHWEATSAEVAVHPPLVISRMALDGCRQSNLVPLTASGRGETRRFQFFRPTAEIDLQFDEERVRVDGNLWATVTLGGPVATAVVHCDLTAVGGERYELSGSVMNSWTVEALEFEPADAVESWSLQGSENGQQLWTARLARPLTSGAPLRLRFQAERPGDSSYQQLSGRELRVVKLDNVVPRRVINVVRVVAGHRLTTINDARMVPLALTALSRSEQDLLQPQAGDYVYFVLHAPPDLAFRVAKGVPRWTAQITTTSLVHGASVDETHQVRCLPEGPGLERLMVTLSQRSPADVQWHLASAPETPLPARRSEDPSDASGGPANGEAWVITLPDSRGQPIEVVGRRKRKIFASGGDREEPMTLVMAPEAATQRGLVCVTVAADAPQGLRVRSRLDAVPALANSLTGQHTILGAFRYPQLNETDKAVPLSVFVEPGAISTATAWVWHAAYATRVTEAGNVVHQLRLFIENHGLTDCEMGVPANAHVVRVAVDDQLIPRASALRAGRLKIQLPAFQRFTVVTIEHVAPQAPLRSIDRLRLSAVVPQLPILHRSWSLDLPPRFATWQHVAVRGPRHRAWTTRLFGPLVGGSRPSAGTSSPGILAGAQRGDRFTVARQWLTQLGTTAHKIRTRKEPVTWYAVLSAMSQAAGEGPPEPALWIDIPALTAAGIRADARVSTPETLAREDGPGLLERWGLVLLADRQGLILTTREALEPFQGRLPVIVPGVAFETAEGVLPAEMEAGRGDGPERLADLATWRLASLQLPRGWVLTSARARTAEAEPNLRTWICPTPRDNEGSVWIYGVPTFTTLGWISFLIATLAVTGARAVQARVLLAVGCVAAAIALITWPPLVPLAVGVAWGVVAGSACRAVTHFYTHARSAEVPRGTRAREIVVATVLVLVHFSPGAGQSPPRESTNEENYRVLFPVDERRQPASKYVYLPADFYAFLHQRARRAQQPVPDWLVTSAIYKGAVSSAGIASAIDVPRVTAVFQVTTTRPNVDVKFALPESWAERLAEDPRWDGHPFQWGWSADRRNLEFVADEPGTHQLELLLTPTRGSFGGVQGIDLPIPAIPTCLCELQLPTSIKALDVTSAVGAVEYDPDRRILSADLGPADALSIRWPSAGAAQVGDAGPALHQLAWMHVEPGKVTLDVRFAVVGDRPIRRFRLEVDPQLQLLPSGAANIAVTPIRGGSDGSSWLVSLSRPLQRGLTPPLQFLVSGASGIGSIRLPRIGPVDFDTSQRWLGVSIAEGLDHEQVVQAGVTAISRQQFADAWGGSPTLPTLALQLPEIDATWSLRTQPRQPRALASEQLDIEYETWGAQVDFIAEIAPVEGTYFRYEVEAPGALAVTDVSLEGGGVRQRPRWSQSGRGLISVFPREPLTGPQRLQVSGHLPPDGLVNQPLPVMHLRYAEVTTVRTRVYRHIDVNVAVVADPDLQRTNVVEESDLNPDRRLVAVLTSENAEAMRGTVRVSANQAEFSARTVTEIVERDRTWWGEVEFHADVLGGRVDTLRFDIPPTWGDALEIQPAVTWEVASLPDGGRRLTVWAPPAANGRIRLNLSGPINSAEGVAVPNVMPLEAAEVQRWIIVPQRLAENDITWQLSRVQPGTLPAGFSTDVAPHRRVYRVSGRDFTAALQTVIPARGVTQVSWQDTYVYLDADALTGWAVYDVRPGGENKLRLNLPPNCQLLWADIDGMPALLDIGPDGQVDVGLPLQRLPQRLHVLFRVAAVAGGSSGPLDVVAPSLENVELGTRLWTLIAPAARGRLKKIEGGRRLTRAQADRLRMEDLTDFVDLPGESVAEYSSDELMAWLTLWNTYTAPIKSAAIWHASRDGGGAWNEGLTRFSETVSKLQERFQSDAERSVPDAGSLDFIYPLQTPVATRLDCQVLTVDSPMDGQPLRLHFADPPGAATPGRWAAAILFALLALLSWRSPKAARIWIFRLLPAATVILGVFWTVCLAMPWIGLLIMLAGPLLAWYAGRWKLVASPAVLADAPTKIRPSVPWR